MFRFSFGVFMVQILRYPCLFLLVFVSRGLCLDSQGVLVKGVAVLFLPRVFFNSYPKGCVWIQTVF